MKRIYNINEIMANFHPITENVVISSLFGNSENSYTKCKNIINGTKSYILAHGEFLDDYSSGMFNNIRKNLIKLMPYRFYFVLNTETFDNLKNSIENNTIKRIYISIFNSRSFESVDKIFGSKGSKDLLDLCDLYINRVNEIYDLFKKYDTEEKIKANILHNFVIGAVNFSELLKSLVGRYI